MEAFFDLDYADLRGSCKLEHEADRTRCRGRHLSYQRGKRNTNPGTSLIKIEGVDNTQAAKYVESRCWHCRDIY